VHKNKGAVDLSGVNVFDSSNVSADELLGRPVISCGLSMVTLENYFMEKKAIANDIHHSFLQNG